MCECECEWRGAVRRLGLRMVGRVQGGGGMTCLTKEKQKSMRVPLMGLEGGRLRVRDPEVQWGPTTCTCVDRAFFHGD